MINFSESQVDEAKKSAPEAVHDFIYSGALADRIESMTQGKGLSPEMVSVLIESIRNSIIGLLPPEEARKNLQEAQIQEATVLDAINLIGEVLKNASEAPKKAGQSAPNLEALHDAEKTEGHVLAPAHVEKPIRLPKEPIQLDLDAPAPASPVSKIVPVSRPAAAPAPSPAPSMPIRPPVTVPRLRTMVSDVEAMGPKTKEAPLHHAPAKNREDTSVAARPLPPKPLPAAAAPGTAPKEYGADPYREPLD